MNKSQGGNRSKLDRHSHKASSTSNHDILDVGTRLKFGGAYEYWGLFPDVDILEVLAMAVRLACDRGSQSLSH